jgi:hypothetical protein
VTDSSDAKGERQSKEREELLQVGGKGEKIAKEGSE